MNNSILNVVLFASEGPPYDNGYPLLDNSLKLKDKLLNDSSNKINTINIYTPRILKSLNYHYHVKEYNNTGCITMNKNLQYIGFCAWRPLILLLELEKINDGDLLVYRDSNYGKYKELENYDNLYEKCNYFLETCNFDFFIPFQNDHLKLVSYCKKDLLVEFGNNDKFLYNVPLLWQSLIIIRKSSISIELLKEWLYACENENFINGEIYRQNDVFFKWSCPEQSILNIIIYKWILQKRHNINEKYPYIICPRNYNNYSLMKNYSHLNNIQINTNKNPSGLNTLWLCWTGSNKMSELRRSCLNNIYRYIEADVILVTKDNLNYYNNKNYPIHEAYQYLSDIHKSDYLRCYLLHNYGGSYIDIKPLDFSIKKFSDDLKNNENIFGYNGWHNGNTGYPSVCSFMYKQNTQFTNELMDKIHKYLDSKLEALKKYPAKHPRHDPHVSLIKNYPYPIGWGDITDKILRKIIIKYKNKINMSFPVPLNTRYSNYKQEDSMITYG